jgi:N-acetylglutamate synthase-like GNAT family acetyltransferase
MQEIKYSRAIPGDEAAIKTLLAACELPYLDITPFLSNFVLARSDGAIVGVIGLEVYGRAALVRSMAVIPDFRRKGIAGALNKRILALGQLLGVQEVYLLTLTAADYASGLGFQKISRDDVPESIQATGEFKSLCPQTAVCMLKRIDREAQYYPGDILTLKDEVPGAKMWGRKGGLYAGCQNG